MHGPCWDYRRLFGWRSDELVGLLPATPSRRHAAAALSAAWPTRAVTAGLADAFRGPSAHASESAAFQTSRSWTINILAPARWQSSALCTLRP